jgi:hypothetical protein
MSHLRPTLTAVLATLVLAAPAAAADRRTEQALAQERTYNRQAIVSSVPGRPASARDDGSPLALIAVALVGASGLAAGGAALVSRRRRPVAASAR